MKKEKMTMEKSAMVLKLLGDKTRLTMLKILDEHSCCVCEFVELFHMSQPAISQHLRKLRAVGLIKEERKGQWIFYSIDKENASYEFILPILTQLPNQAYRIKELQESGKRIICC